MKFTELTAPSRIKGWIEGEGQEIIRLKKEEKERGVTEAATSKRVTELFIKCRSEIDREGPKFAEEEKKAAELVLKLNELSKTLAKKCSDAVDLLKKSWDEKKVKEIEQAVVMLRKLDQDAANIRVEAVKHQGWRGNFPKGEAVWGASMQKQLAEKFLGYRDGPLKEFMGVDDKFAKITEHRKRGEHFLALLPSIKKSVPDEKTLLAVTADHKQFEDWMKPNGAFEKIPTVIGDLKRYHTTLKQHKSKPCSTDYMKLAKTGLSKYEMDVKGLRSQLKTAGMLKDGFPKKAGALLKENKEVSQMYKTIQTNYGQMDKLLKQLIEQLKATTEEYGKVEKLMSK